MKILRVLRYCTVSTLAAVLGAPGLLPAANEKPTPPKTHVLFLGADLSVQRDKNIYRVEDVTGSTLRIRVDRQEVLVPTRQGPVALQVNASLKLAGASVQLDHLESGPAYTYANDPMRKLQEANAVAMTVADAQDIARGQLARAQDSVAGIQAAAANPHAPSMAGELAAAKAAVDAGQRQLNTIDITALGDMPSAGAGAARMSLAEGKYDAMEVSFKVSSAVELDRPYMVVLFKFHAPDAKPGVDGMVIHAQALDPVDAKPHYVRVLKGGLPRGFKFVECTVHIYNHGEEVATNLSSKRVELTRDETQLYLVMEHLGAHKGASLPAAAVPGTLLRPQRASLTPTELTRTFYARVTRDGALLGIYEDEECKLPLNDPGIATALGEVFFTPALEQGKPVDGVARLRLDKI